MQQNMGGMIKPTGAGAVRLPGAGDAMGSMNRGTMMGQQQQDPMAVFRQVVETGMASTAGGIKWEQYGAGGSYDNGLQEIANESGPDADSIQYLAASVAPANVMYLQQIFNRTGKFYEVYRQTVESFCRSDVTGQPCPVRDAFVKMFQKHQEFTRPVAINSSSLFGWRLISIKRETHKDELTANQYLSAAEVAIRSVLFMEMVNWLMRTAEGQQHARQLPPDLAAKMPNIPKFNEVIDSACAAFGVNNPYANVTFEVATPARTDLSTNRYEGGSNYLYGGQHNSVGKAEISQEDELFEFVRKNALRAQGFPMQETRPVETNQESLYGGSERWNKIRGDFENLTPTNKHEFQLHRFFHAIGKPNHYFIPESDWKAIKKAFKKHPEMKQELTVQDNCFRIVIIDLNADSGWFSTIVRSEDYDMPTLLTDPSKLLPLLEDADNTGLLSVVAVPVKDVLKDGKLEVDYDDVRKLEKSVPVIICNEQIVAADSRVLETTMSAVNIRLTQNFTKENAVSFNAMIHDTFSCASQEIKVRLFHDAPYLFKDSEMETRPSWFTACKLLLAYFKQGTLDKETYNFIDSRLTTIMNDYFINCAGYDSYPHEKNHLSVDSIIRDYDELDLELERSDPIMFALFNQNDPNHYLSQALKIFTYNDPFAASSDKELTVIEQIRHEQELVLERPLHVTYINNRGGPYYTDANVPVIMKRSQFPEYFELVEKSFEPTMGELPFDATDKLLYFAQSNHLWLFSYSAIDKNMATLRHVSRKETLVLLALN